MMSSAGTPVVLLLGQDNHIIKQQVGQEAVAV
jgi:hypothetical protein